VTRHGLVRQPERSQQPQSDSTAQTPERLPARGGLGQTFGQFIELVVHSFPFVRFVDTQEVSGESIAWPRG
jgi:hypothetical protein